MADFYSYAIPPSQRKTPSPVDDPRTQLPRDDSWIKQSFMLPDKTISDLDAEYRTLTDAAYKYTDTTVGGNFAINPPPQFTRFADIKMGGAGNLPHKSRAKSQRVQADGKGMGRYYSEALDDNGQYVIMSFGVPTFNSLMSFFGTFYSSAASVMARTGRASPGLFYGLGKAAGFVVALPFQPFILGGQIIKYLLGVQATKFYYLKPAMPLYWNAVNTIANGIAVNMGLIPHHMSPGESSTKATQPNQVIDQAISGPKSQSDARENAKLYHQMFPDIYSEKGGIDVYAIATRAQRLANQYYVRMQKILNDDYSHDGGIKGFRKAILEFQTESLKRPSKQGLSTYLQSYLELSEGTPKSDHSEASTDAKETDKAQGVDTMSGDKPGIFSNAMSEFHNWLNGFKKGVAGGRQDGSNFITFRVDYTGPAGESFSSTTRESDLAQKVNSMSSQARSAEFNFAHGNISDGAIGKVIGGTYNAVKDFVGGVADAIHVSGLAALGGAAFVDIPNMWDNSSVNLPRMDFTMELRTPYGNKLSRFQSLYIPLAMILAGALPLATGRHSFTSPFLCELYCRGRAQTRLGIIDSLSITRGTGNLGWTPDGEPLGVDISFSVIDMSTIMHMPIADNTNFFDKLAVSTAEAAGGDTAGDIAAALSKGTYSDDNLFNDYLAVLGSLSFTDQVYAFRKWGFARARTKAAVDSWRSPWHTANWFIGSLPGRALTAISRGTDRG